MTLIVCLKARDSIVVAADSLTTNSSGHVFSKQTNKIHKFGQKAATAGCGLARVSGKCWDVIFHSNHTQVREDADNPLPVLFRTQLSLLQHHMAYLFDVIATLDKQIEQCYRQNALCQRIGKIPGIGPVTASALIATIGKANNFEKGRQLAAWLGLVPRQHSSGGKQVLLGISKRGDTYLRTLLIHGARAVLQSAKHKQDAVSSWANQLMARRNNNIASVALANKNARTVWALLAKEREYCAPIISA